MAMPKFYKFKSQWIEQIMNHDRINVFASKKNKLESSDFYMLKVKRWENYTCIIVEYRNLSMAEHLYFKCGVLDLKFGTVNKNLKKEKWGMTSL